MSRKIKVLIVDDSAVMRQLLTAVLEEDSNIKVVGTALDPFIARNKIKTLKPDVLTLDVEMPGMDGITFLEKLMRLRPMPVVMVSSLTEKGADATLRALELGAVDFVTKPQFNVRESFNELAEEIRAKVLTAAQAHLRPPLPMPQLSSPQLLSRVTGTPRKDALIAIGASAGGTLAIKELLAPLPADTPGIVIVQHMPPKFTRLFAERLDSQCAIEVREAVDGDRVCPGLALIAPGGYHMAVRRDAQGYRVHVYIDEPVNIHRPSVDVLFHSVAACTGNNALGVILTGMGNDGARGMLAMKEAGAYTLAQDEKSCVVFGMPDQAIRLGGVHEVLPLESMAARVMEWSGLSLTNTQFYG